MAGLLGVQQRLRLPAPVALDPGTLTDAQRQAAGIAALPTSLGQAIEAFEQDSGKRQAALAAAGELGGRWWGLCGASIAPPAKQQFSATACCTRRLLSPLALPLPRQPPALPTCLRLRLACRVPGSAGCGIRHGYFGSCLPGCAAL